MSMDFHALYAAEEQMSEKNALSYGNSVTPMDFRAFYPAGEHISDNNAFSHGNSAAPMNFQAFYSAENNNLSDGNSGIPSTIGQSFASTANSTLGPNFYNHETSTSSRLGDFSFRGISEPTDFGDLAMAKEHSIYTDIEIDLSCQHYKSVSDLNPFQYNVTTCNSSGFSSEASLLSHKRKFHNEHNSTKTNSYQCKNIACKRYNYSFSSGPCLFRHEREAHNIFEGQYPCIYNGCAYRYKRKASLNAHIRKKHNNLEPTKSSASTSSPLSMADVNPIFALEQPQITTVSPVALLYHTNEERRLETIQQLQLQSTYDPGAVSSAVLPSTIAATQLHAIITDQKHYPSTSFSPNRRCESIDPQTKTPCNTSFSRPSNPKRHEDNIHNPGKQIFSCNRCTNRSYSRFDNLQGHILSCHGAFGG